MSRPPLGSIAFWQIPWYSVLIVAAVIIGIFLASREEKRLGLPRDSILDFVLWAVPLAIVGARLFYVAFRWELYADNLLRIFNIREGGLAIYGGILGGLLAALIVTRRKNIPIAKLLDACAPALLLGQAIGRWGNYANMEAYGPVVENAALQFFPFAVEIPTASGWTWHMATFFYESLWCAIGFALLWGLRKRMRRSGDVMLWYALWYSAGRAVIEGLRTDSLVFLGGAVRISQLLSVAAIAMVLIIFARRIRPLGAAGWLGWLAALVAIACAIVSEAIRTAFPAWWRYGLLLCGALAAADLVFLIAHSVKARRFDITSLVWLLLLGLTVAMTWFGRSAALAVSLELASLRQALCFAHTLAFGLWLYQHHPIDAPKSAQLQKEA